MKSPDRTLPDLVFQLDEFYLDLREDGHSISFLDKEAIERHPFPGLRPFKTSEFQLFHGRDGQAEELINRLKKRHFLAVIGSSGTGKSSLIRAGLIPQLLAGYLHGAGANWNVAICRPGKDPVENLSLALARIKSKSNNKEDIIAEYDVVAPLLKATMYGILDVNELLNEQAKEKTNLLIIIDQFEELFRFKRDDLENPDTEDHFVNLLLKASANPDVPIYVIITMRSEYLGDCAKYRGLPEAINEGQYLVPQLNRQQIKEVIEDPVTLAGKNISPGLVELLINEIEESKSKKDLDQLPVFQHALMRTYAEAMKHDKNAEIVYDHYKAAGGVENALADHAESKYRELGDGSNQESQKQKIAKIVFQALTDAGTDEKKGRRPTDLENIYAIAASITASEIDVNEVIDHFRDVDTSFIMPPLNTPLNRKLVMDISHETLMRQWKRLENWIEIEAYNAQMLLRLCAAQKLYEKGEREYLRGKELDRLSDWYDSLNPQPAWANRYSSEHARCFDYLHESEKARQAAKNKKETERRQKIRRKRITLIGALAAIILTAFLVKMYEDRESALEKANDKRVLLLEKRSRAIEDGHKLVALIYTAEAIVLERDPDAVMKHLNDSREKKLVPKFTLDSIITSPGVVHASITNDGKTIHIWKENSYEEMHVHNGTGPAVRSDQYVLDTSKKDWITYKTPSGRDTVLAASSRHYKRLFVNMLGKYFKDEMGLIELPRPLKTIKGANISKDGALILTWGESTEFPYTSINRWDSLGISQGIPLIHNGIEGATLSADNGRIVSWESDTIMLWKKDTFDLQLPPRLIKMQTEVFTGVKMDTEDYSIKLIPMPDYIKRKRDFEVELEKYRKEKKR